MTAIHRTITESHTYKGYTDVLDVPFFENHSLLLSSTIACKNTTHDQVRSRLLKSGPAMLCRLVPKCCRKGGAGWAKINFRGRKSGQAESSSVVPGGGNCPPTGTRPGRGIHENPMRKNGVG